MTEIDVLCAEVEFNFGNERSSWYRLFSAVWEGRDVENEQPMHKGSPWREQEESHGA